jgi:hypothetical protein
MRLEKQSGVRIPVGARYVSLLQDIQTGSGAYSASFPMGTEFFPRVKWPGCYVDHSLESSAEVTAIPAFPLFTSTT